MIGQPHFLERLSRFERFLYFSGSNRAVTSDSDISTEAQNGAKMISILVGEMEAQNGSEIHKNKISGSIAIIGQMIGTEPEIWIARLDILSSSSWRIPLGQ